MSPPKKSSSRAVCSCTVLGAAALLAVLTWLWLYDSSPATAISDSATVTRGPVAPSLATAPASSLTSATSSLAAPSATDAFAATLATIRAKLGSDATPDQIMAALQAIARDQPGLAIDLAHALGSTREERDMWVSDLARQWTEREPQQAWNWLSQLEKSRIQNLATGALPEVIIGVIAKAQPELLLRNLDSLVLTGETPHGVAPVVAVHLGLEALTANNEFDRARQAVENWASDPRRPTIGESAYTTVADAWARTSPSPTALGEAGAWLKSLPATEARDIALVEFPAHWAAQQRPQAALDWIEQNVSPELRDRAVQRTFSDWVERSPAEAGEWLGQYLSRAPAGADTDKLIGSLVNLGAAVKQTPAVALQWSALIADPALRSATEERIALRWGRQDRQAALDYIARTPTLTPDRKLALQLQMEAPTYLQSQD